MKTLLKNNNIEIKVKEDLDLNEIIDTSFDCISEWLVWIKTICMVAKDPNDLWVKIKPQIEWMLEDMEEVLHNN